MIRIEERMYSVAEVARLIGHQPPYIHALIDRGILEGIRVEGPDGRMSQWRIYPGNLRKWLGVTDRSARRNRRKAEREREDWDRFTGRAGRESASLSPSASPP